MKPPRRLPRCLLGGALGLLAAFVCAAAGALAAAQTRRDTLPVAPVHHAVPFERESVRVPERVDPPGDKIAGSRARSPSISFKPGAR